MQKASSGKHVVHIHTVRYWERMLSFRALSVKSAMVYFPYSALTFTFLPCEFPSVFVRKMCVRPFNLQGCAAITCMAA